MATGSLGSLVVSLAVDTARFQGDLGRAAAIAERRMKNIRDTATRAFTALTIAATAAGAALVAAVGSSLKRADELLELSQALGTTVENLSALTYASSLAGVSQEELGTAIRKLASTAVDASNGVAASAGAFKALDIEVKRADGSLKSVDELVGEIADAFAAAPDSITKTAIATDLFGRAGAKLIPLLNEGAAGIDEMKQRARELGLVISTQTAKAADQFFDSLTDLKAIGTGFSNLLAAELAPNLANLAKQLTDAASGADKLKGLSESTANVIRFFASSFVVLGFAVQAAGKNLGGFFAALNQFDQFEFSKGFEILNDRMVDFQGEMQLALDVVKSIYDETAADISASAPELGAELAAPVIEAAKLSKAELERLEVELAKFARFQQEIAKQITDPRGREFNIAPLRGVVADSEAALLNQSLGDSAEANAQAINEAMAEITASNTVATSRVIELGQAFEMASESAKGLMDTIKDEVARQSFVTIRDLIYDFSKGADNFGKRMLDAIRMILSDQATRQLFEAFSGLGSGGGGGFLGAIGKGIGWLFGAGSGSGSSSSSGLASGFRGLAADGMSLRPGQWAIAGETGEPEAVFGGAHGAQIVPFPKGGRGGIGGGGDVRVSVDARTSIDARGASPDFIRQVGPLLEARDRRLKAEIEEHVVQGLRRQRYNL